MKSAAIYLRVSTNAQDTASQEPDLQAWASSQSRPVLWFVDKASGKSMDRPAWKQLETAMQQGHAGELAGCNTRTSGIEMGTGRP